jgi:hypothetical protein
MKRGYFATRVITLLAAAGLSLGLGLSASAGAATTHAAIKAATDATQASPQYVVRQCNFKPVVEPATYEIACADDGLGISGVHWTTWGPHLASGYGTSWENLCVPDCADGKIAHYPVLVVLYGSATVKGYPADRRYTELTLVYTGKRPPYYQLINGKVVTEYPATLTVPAN